MYIVGIYISGDIAHSLAQQNISFLCLSMLHYHTTMPQQLWSMIIWHIINYYYY